MSYSIIPGIVFGDLRKRSRGQTESILGTSKGNKQNKTKIKKKKEKKRERIII